MTFSVEEIIGKYVELRDRKAALAKKHDEEMKQFTEPMANIENFLMHQMNTMGVEAFKGATGTAYKTTTTSVQLKEAGEFKQFVFEPVVEGILTHLKAIGIHIDSRLPSIVEQIVRDLPRWDIVELRAGKKGIQEYMENSDQTVPGVAINSFASINIRRA